ncbi:MAG: hypothetical protein ABSG21_03100 [Spirochaetia bacterium]|jgi:hypothetical protein
MRYSEPFTVYRRREAKKVYWYFRVRDEGGRRSTGRSTGKTTKAEARAYVLELFKAGSLTAHHSQTFGTFASSWWLWDKCQYVSRKLARGHSMSRGYVDVRSGYLDNHLLPYFREMKLANINARMIEEWITALRQKKAERGGLLSATTINQCLTTLRIMLGEAERLSYIARDSSRGIEGLKESPRERNILEPAEAKALFDEASIGKVWGNDLRHYTLKGSRPS